MVYAAAEPDIIVRGCDDHIAVLGSFGNPRRALRQRERTQRSVVFLHLCVLESPDWISHRSAQLSTTREGCPEIGHEAMF